jgi:4-amino-4-deoxy-L-arabinose transferase-like glycosyltransferase
MSHKSSIPAILAKRWFLVAGITLFIIAKVPDLNMGFYWDESSVYAPAVSLMYAHGPSLLPNAIPTDFSRGHPLLFQAACAGWMDLFGSSHGSMHSFALFVSVILAIAVFEILLRLFSGRAAMMGLVLLLLNQAFFVYSSSVLNDLLLSLFLFLSLYAYAKERYVAAAACLALAFYTKESGFVIAIIIFADILLSIARKVPLKQIVGKSLSLLAPLFVVAVFFIIQKKTFGWFLYPLHTSLINLNPENTLHNLQQTFDIFFFRDAGYWSWGVGLFLSLLAAVMRRKPGYLFFMLCAIFVYCSVFVFSFKDAIFYAMVVFLIAGLSIFLYKRWPAFTPLQERFIKLTLAFSALYICFCCVNFFEGRYLFPAMILLSVVLSAVLFDRFAAAINTASFPYVFTILISSGLYSFIFQNGELEFYNRVSAWQELVDYFEKNDLYDKNIFCSSYLEQVHLTDPKTGFLHSAKTFANTSVVPGNNTDLLVFDNIEFGDFDSLRNSKDFFLWHRIDKGTTWITVYKRKDR